MKLSKKHLAIFDQYEGKKSSLEKVGTKKEKEIFQNGEFEKIEELIKAEYRIKSNQATESEIENYKGAIDSLFDSNWNKRSIKYLSKKYYGPKKEKSTFESIMDMLWAMFG